MVNTDWLPPSYLSPSQVSSLLTCGEQFRLTRVEQAPERPMWAGIGGSAVHRATELRDRQRYEGGEVSSPEEAFAQFWVEEFEETMARHPEFDPADYYVSGRVSKAWPNKEDPDWWAENGPKFVRAWENWCTHIGLTLWEYPDAEGTMRPGIEVEVWGEGDDDLSVRSIIDRVMVDALGRLYIIDIKTGSMTPAFPMQMALNNLGLLGTHEVNATFAGFWSARKGGVGEWTPLSRYTEDWLWEQVWKAREIRNRQLFIPQPGNLCNSACGVKQWCVAMGGTPFFSK
jgi:hypothetical protein